VYGGIDGIITTFAVVAGFSGAQTAGADPTLPTLAVLLFGFANLFGDASSMGLGNFLSVRADQDVYKKEQEKELREIEENPEYEIRETQYMLTEKGFTASQAEQLTSMYATNKDFWVDFMMREELEMQNPMQDNPLVSATVTASSFMIFGVIPLIPYVFFREVFSNQFAVSITFTFAALISLGLVRLKVANQGFIRSVGETVLIGCISAGVAYVVGTFFRV
jgi:VIT1/CCC1 family predicted Fe2+/Mn2+ transporter